MSITEQSGSEKEKQHSPSEGHRARLRERFLKGDGEGMLDYEILELLLSYAVRQRDVKQQAKTLMEEFKSFQGVVDADTNALCSTKDIGKMSAILIKLIRSMAVRYLRPRDIPEQEFMNDSTAFSDYARFKLCDRNEEAMLVFFLNTKSRLICDEIISEGIVDQVPVILPKIAKRAMNTGAKAVVLCHNHPSGDTTPSACDNFVTSQVRMTLEPLNIILLDHLIVSREGYYSYRFADEQKPPGLRLLAPLTSNRKGTRK